MRTAPSLWENLSWPALSGIQMLRALPMEKQDSHHLWLVILTSPRPTHDPLDPLGWGSCRELVAEPGLGRPMASNIQSDIIWPRFPETKIRPRKFRMLLQISKKNRGGGQKMDHKRIFVTQSQLGKTAMSSTYGKRQRNLLSIHYKGRPKLSELACSD